MIHLPNNSKLNTDNPTCVLRRLIKEETLFAQLEKVLRDFIVSNLLRMADILKVTSGNSKD